jgi:hypothetical protein
LQALNFQILLRHLSKSKISQLGRPIIHDLLVFLAFILATVLMTWPWALHLRDAVPDTGDPYAISYLLWWDYHQTFHAPLRLFEATFLFPYHSTLAFGEYNYGVSLLCFPLFFFGLRPLTVYSVASFLSFPLTGYGMFRLARTLSTSRGIAWVAGIIVAFLPFRFHHLAHLHLNFFVWSLLLFEALILFARQRSWPRAIWLGFVFLMHALTCMTWLLLTIIPLVVSTLLLLDRNRAWRDIQFWKRAGISLGIVMVMLLPFLLPVRRVAIEHGFLRSRQEVAHYSAGLINWLAVDERTRFWHGLGAPTAGTEMVLFPGLLAPLLAMGAFFLAPARKGRAPGPKVLSLPKRIIVHSLDAIAIGAGAVVLLSLGNQVFKLSLFGNLTLQATGLQKAIAIVFVAFLIRWLIAYPAVLRRWFGGDSNLRDSFKSAQRSELFGHALVWMAIGFAGSFGLNFFFHKLLYDYMPLFRGMRAATRWAMICYVGLALLAGLGAYRFSERIRRRFPRLKTAGYVLIIAAVLVELHATPLAMVRGAVDPDAISIDLKNRTMQGGILELPIGDGDHVYMLRAADHLHRIVNGRYSFVPPLQLEIEALTKSRPIPDRLFDIIEEIPVSYVTVHRDFIGSDDLPWIEDFLTRGLGNGRLRFIKSFPAATTEDPNQTVDLYAVVKIEPNVQAEAAKRVD